MNERLALPGRNEPEPADSRRSGLAGMGKKGYIARK